MSAKKPTASMKADLIGEVSPPKEHKPLNGLTKTGALARPKSGGRQPGTKNKLEVSIEMMGDILGVYQKLGGQRWLLAWAKKNETQFIKEGLSRLFPTPPRDPEIEIQNNLTVDSMSDFEVARRIAFCLASGMHAAGLPLGPGSSPVALTGEETDTPAVQPAPRWISPWDRPPANPSPEGEFQALVQDQQRQQANALIADTLGGPNDYHGSSAEQGLVRRRSLY